MKRSRSGNSASPAKAPKTTPTKSRKSSAAPEALEHESISDTELDGGGGQGSEGVKKGGGSGGGGGVKLFSTVMRQGRRDALGLDMLKSLFIDKVREITGKYDEIERVPRKEIIQEIRQIFQQSPDNDETERKLFFDQALRDLLLESFKIQPREIKKFKFIVDFSILLSREGITTPASPITLLTDLVELSSLKETEGTFQIIEERLEVWKEPLFLNSGKNAVLRMCNDLLRRLSRSQNTIFYGRILIFLANYFPFSERSGLNLMSEFNADNVTLYKTGDGSDDPDDKMEEGGEGSGNLFEGIEVGIPGIDKIVSESQEDKNNKMRVDYNLYIKFWSLQDYFRNPVSCYNKIAWKTFTTYLGDVLNAFHFFKIQDHNAKSEELKNLELQFQFGSTDDLYFAKYLTNRRLLELQLSDVSFRRYFLVQVLIIFQYLTMNVRFKGEGQTLAEEQIEFVKKSTQKAYELLEEIPPEGSAFVAAVKHTLEREKIWNKWKNERCPPFKKPDGGGGVVGGGSGAQGIDEEDGEEIDKGSKAPPMSQKDMEEYEDNEQVVLPHLRRRPLGDIVEEADSVGKVLLGNPELTKLWNISADDFDICRSSSRDFMPSIEVFFADAMKEIDSSPSSLNMPPDAYKKDVKPKKILGNSIWGWKARRLLARKSPYFFQICGSSPITPMQNYLEFILKKIILEAQLASQGPIPDSGDKTNEGEDGKEGEVDEAQMLDDVDEVEEELLNSGGKKDEPRVEGMDEEEGEVGPPNDKIRNLTADEQIAVGKALGGDFVKLGTKLGFSTDELEYFQEEAKENPGSYLLKIWTEQEGVEATVADLLYRVEGIGLLDKIAGIFP